MRFEQQICACLRSAALLAMGALVFASGRPVFAFEQAPVVTQQPVSPAPQTGSVLPLTADEAVRLALENNLGIQAERLNPQIQQFGVAQAQGVFRPALISNVTSRSSTTPPSNFLTGSGDIITDDSFRTNVGMQQQVPWGGGRYQFTLDASRSTTTGFTNYNPQLGSNFSGSFTQPLLRNFSIDGFRQQLLVSRNLAQIADIQLRQQVTVTSRNVRSAYYDLVGAITGLQVSNQSLDLARESLKNNRRRVEVGTMAPIDITEAEAEVARNEENVILAEGRIQAAQDRLRALVLNPSQPDFWTTRIEPAEQPVMTPQAIDVDGAVANALANRTDIAELKKRLEATDINIRYARNQRLPAVDLTANYNLIGLAGTQFQFAPGGVFPPTIQSESQRSFSEALRDVFANEFRTWSVQVNISYPIGTSVADAALAQSRLQMQQGQAGLRELELFVATAVRDGARQVNTNQKRVEATRKARELAERRLEAEEKRLAVGLSDTFRLFQAQRDLALQRQQELNAIIDYNRSLVDFQAVQVVPIR